MSLALAGCMSDMTTMPVRAVLAIGHVRTDTSHKHELPIDLIVFSYHECILIRACCTATFMPLALILAQILA